MVMSCPGNNVVPHLKPGLREISVSLSFIIASQITSSHEPLKLPPVLASILKEINNNKKNIFIQFLSEEPQACAEASFEKLYTMLLK